MSRECQRAEPLRTGGCSRTQSKKVGRRLLEWAVNQGGLPGWGGGVKARWVKGAERQQAGSCSAGRVAGGSLTQAQEPHRGVGQQGAGPAFIGLWLRHSALSREDCFTGEPCGNPQWGCRCQEGGWAKTGNVHISLFAFL